MHEGRDLMVIQCPQCHTRFKLAEEKLKPGGTKVCCARCKHIFRVMPPESVPEYLPPFPPPQETKERIDSGDLQKQNIEEEIGLDFSSIASEQQENAVFEEADEEEGLPSFDEENSEKEEAIFSFEEEENIEKEAGSAQAASEQQENAVFEEADEEESLPSFDEENSEKEEAEGFSFSEEESSEFSLDEEETPGNLGEFDFDKTDESTEIEDSDSSEATFGEEEPPEAPLAGEKDDSSDQSQKIELAEPMASQGQVHNPQEVSQKIESVTSPASPRSKSPLAGFMIFILVLLLAFGGVAGYFFWKEGTLDIRQIINRFTGFTGQKAPAIETGQIRLEGLTSFFVNNKEAGQLFVIKGQAVNEYTENRSAIAVKGILHNKEGEPLLQQTVFCGNPLDKAALQNLPFAKIEESINNQFGDSLSNLNVATGATIPFTIVFKNLPPDLSEFTVEVVDSKPGSEK
jgi:predicted Zn finger-like uncharacterized protein